VIGLHVRLDDVADAHALLRRGLEIRLDVVLWIHTAQLAAPLQPST